MSEDPVARSTISALKELAKRHSEVALVLSVAIQELESRSDPSSALAPQSSQRTAEAGPGATPDSPTIRAFSARLAQVYGVSRVTVASAGPGAYRFLVEMDLGGDA